MPLAEPMPNGKGVWKPEVIREAETKTLGFFGIMLGVLALKSFKA